MNTAVEEWASAYRAGLDPEIKARIGQAKYDLYYGPGGGGLDSEDEDFPYPGFEKACEQIRGALESVGDLYVDDYSGVAETVKPEAGKCTTCEGSGECNDPDCPDDGCACPDCKGSGFESEPEYTTYDRSDVVAAIVGRELAEYVR